MTENQYWSSWIKPRWHVPQKHWVAKKVQDITNRGLADTICCFNGSVVKIELKYRLAEPKSHDKPIFFSKDKTTKKPCIVSVEQGRDLLEWYDAGGQACVLIAVGNYWWLMDYSTLSLWNLKGINLNELTAYATVAGHRTELQRVPELFEQCPPR